MFVVRLLLVFCKSQAICLKSDLIFVMPVVATSITAASKAHEPSGAHIICVIFFRSYIFHAIFPYLSATTKSRLEIYNVSIDCINLLYPTIVNRKHGRFKFCA